MKEILVTSVFIPGTLPLEDIANFFKVKRPLKWKDYFVLKDEYLEMVLKYAVPDKYVYIFDFGAITFVNVHTNEIKIVMNYLQSIIGPLDYNLFMNSCEAHTIVLLDNNQCKLWPRSQDPIEMGDYVIPITAEVLAQSVAIEHIEGVLTTLLEEADLMLNLLDRGKLRARSRKIGMLIAKIIKFQYETIRSIHIFDRPKFSDEYIMPREVHTRLVEYYELYDRFHIIETKSQDLLNICSTYSSLSNKKAGYRLYVLQAFLLFLFPLNFFVGEDIRVAISQLIIYFQKIMPF